MHNLTCVYKCLQNIAPDLIKSYFIKSSDVYSIRGNGLDILIPKVRTESAKKGTFYSGAQAFNDLPPHLKEVDSKVIFKTQLSDNNFLEFWLNVWIFFYLLILVIFFLAFIHRLCTWCLHFSDCSSSIVIFFLNC